MGRTASPRPGRKNADVHVILLAGGSGTRFWPLSRSRKPKQLLPLAGRSSLLAMTWRRARKLVPPSRLWVAAPASLEQAIRGELPALRADRLILEPSPRDTGPAVALACAAVERVAPSAVVAIFPTDHVIPKVDAFVKAVGRAVTAARGGALVCLAIRPDRPATGFGYLKCRPRAKGGRGGALEVERFVEKPDLARARRFLRDGNYLWNGGMFVWRVDRFREELARTAPAIGKAVDAFLGGAPRAWTRATRLSVDYAVMEKARDVKAVPLVAGWDDVGSWDAAARLREGSPAPQSDAILVDSEGSAVFSDRRLVAVVDVPGIVVVDTPDALLVVSRDGSEKVREVVRRLKRGGGKRLL